MHSPAQTAGILSFQEAYALVETYCRRVLDRPKQAEEVPLLQSLGRVLCEPVLADRDLPPFPRATRHGDPLVADHPSPHARISLCVVGQVKAGDSYDLPLASGEAVEIMTGAAVPQGADAVVMVEYTERKTNHKGHQGSQREAVSEQKAPDDVLEGLGEAKGNSVAIEPDDLV